MKRTGLILQSLRIGKKFTLKNAASCLNIHPVVLDQIERGKLIPTKKQIFEFSNLLNHPVNDLLITYQEERIYREFLPKGSTGVNLSTITNNKQILAKRYQNMNHELQNINMGNLDIKVYKPAYPLSTYIESITYYNGHNFDSSSEKIMPDGSVNLWIELDGKERVIMTGAGRKTVKEAWITGIQKKEITYLLNTFQTSLNIRFQPGGFRAFSNVPVNDIGNTVVGADILFGKSIRQLRESLLNQGCVQEIFGLTETYFQTRIKAADSTIFRHLLDHQSIPIRILSRKTGFSQKHLISVYKIHFGITPKKFQRIRRFNQTLNQIQTLQEGINWADVAYSNQYYDQAHFIREFTDFSGMSPQNYLAMGSTCTRIVRENNLR